jgi:hypothetical protein
MQIQKVNQKTPECLEKLKASEEAWMRFIFEVIIYP